jgi:cell division protein FtsZ
MTEMGKAMMGTGEASGEDRALMAAQNAIQNPLLDEVSLKGAKAVLVNVTGGPDMTLLEVDEACNAISSEVDPDANTIFGAAFDDSLEGKIRVSVVATGMDGASISAIEQRPVRITAPIRAPEPIETVQDAEDEIETAIEAEAEPEIAPIAAAVQAEEASDTVLKIIDTEVDAFETEARAAPEFELTPLASAAHADADMDEESLIIPPRRGQPQPQQHKGGWLSLFGGRRPEPTSDEPPMPQFRNPNAGVPAMKSTASAQAIEEAEPEDDLEIPSFLRRLAN